MNGAAAPRTAPSLLAPIFSEILCEDGADFEFLESGAIAAGRSVTAEAMSMAIEKLDERLCAAPPEGCRASPGARPSASMSVEVRRAANVD